MNQSILTIVHGFVEGFISGILRLLIVFAVMAIAVILTINLIVLNNTKGDIATISSVPNAKTAFVFGASVISNQRPSPMYKARLDTAVLLYKTGKVQQIFVSGDGKCSSYNETVVGKKYLIAQEIPESVITVDSTGIDTYNSIYRASRTFNLDLSRTILVSQDFHLKRALYLAESMGHSPYAVSSPKDDSTWGQFREVFARIKAYLQVHTKLFSKLVIKWCE